MPVSWNTLPSHSSAFKIEDEKAQIKDDIEDEGWVEEDEDVDLPRPPGPPPPFPQDLEQSPSFFSGLLGTLSEAWKLTSDIHSEVEITFTNSISVNQYQESGDTSEPINCSDNRESSSPTTIMSPSSPSSRMT